MLASRSKRALSPPTEYLQVLFASFADAYDKETNAEGALNMAVAQNSMTFPPLRERLSNTASPPDVAAGYGDNRGILPLRAAFAKILSRFITTHKVDPNKLCLQGGCTAILDHLAFLMCEHGDGILLPTPYYSAFVYDLEVKNGVHVLPVKTTHPSYSLTEEALDEAYAKGEEQGHPAKAMIICNPKNPNGTCYSERELKMCVRWCRDHGIHLISDEIYALSTFNAASSDHPFLSITSVLEEEGMKDDVHVIYGLSKDFAISGFRVGGVYTHNMQIIQAFGSIGIFGGLSSFLQYHLAQVLEDEDFVTMYLETCTRDVRASYKQFTGGLDRMGLPYTNAYTGLFVWTDFRQLGITTFEDEKKLFLRLSNECKIICVPGKECGYHVPGFFRFVYPGLDLATQQVALSRLGKFVDSVKKALANESLDRSNNRPDGGPNHNQAPMSLDRERHHRGSRTLASSYVDTLARRR